MQRLYKIIPAIYMSYFVVCFAEGIFKTYFRI